jgi:hypothetical protein
MRYAIGLQNLIYLLAFKYIAAGQIGHEHIPDDPFVESERRQIVFGTAIGIPTFFVRLDTGNALMKHIMERTHGIRRSRRYPGYLRVYNLEYRKALVRVLRDDASDLIEILDAGDILEDLKNRLEAPEYCSAFGKLTSGILGEAGVSSPLAIDAYTFNSVAEKYYRTILRNLQMQEAFQFLFDNAKQLEANSPDTGADIRQALHSVLGNMSIREFLALAQREIFEGRATKDTLQKLICLLLIDIHYESSLNHAPVESQKAEPIHATSVH